jgi:hypothetical protein
VDTRPLVNYLQASAQAAAKSCLGRHDSIICGLKWYLAENTRDGTWGVGQQLSALEMLQSLLVWGSLTIFAGCANGYGAKCCEYEHD